MKNLNAALAEAGTRNPAAFGKVTLGDYQLAFEAQAYAFGEGAPLALALHVMEDGRPVEPWSDVTSCVRGAQVEPDEVIVKTYNESEVMREPLLATGYFEDTGKRIASGFAELEVWRLKEAFVQAFAAVTPFDATAASPAAP